VRMKSQIMSMFRTFLAVMLAAGCGLGTSTGWAAEAPDTYTPAPENMAARQWFQDAKFGIFLHWGLYSELGGAGKMGIAEWIMNDEQIPARHYERLAKFFNPTAFNADAWVSTFKSAGAKYVVITSKHHEGFAMFASKVSPYNIVAATPFKRDPMAELAEACRKQGIKLFFYYSQLDWHHPDYWPRGETGRWSGRPMNGDWNRYLDFLDTQLGELLTNYGAVGGIWFDGMWDKPNADWRLPQTYGLIHRLQPAALIIPNHHKAPLAGEDVQTFEQDLPGANTAGFNTTEIGNLPTETSLTMNGSWGFNITDRNFKSVRELVGTLVRAAGTGTNLLLNIGPRPDGTIDPEFTQRLQAIGQWLAKNGRSIYGTRAGPIPPRSWGATTRRGDTVYVHVLSWSDRSLAVPALGARVRRASLLETGEAVPVTETPEGITLTLPARAAEALDQVVVLETTRQPSARR